MAVNYSQDILVDVDQELIFKNGDFNIGYSAQQEVEAIVISELYEFKQNPLSTVGTNSKLNSPSTPIEFQQFKSEVNKKLVAQGFDTSDLNIVYDFSTRKISINYAPTKNIK